MFSYPKRKYPFVILGLNIRRWERNTDDSAYKNPEEQVTECGGFSLWQDRSSEKWGPSEMQKHSPFGFLLVWPLCFNVWWQLREQVGNKPGSERVLFWRIGLWRWDPQDTKYIGPGTWNGPSLHWD